MLSAYPVIPTCQWSAGQHRCLVHWSYLRSQGVAHSRVQAEAAMISAFALASHCVAPVTMSLCASTWFTLAADFHRGSVIVLEQNLWETALCYRRTTGQRQPSVQTSVGCHHLSSRHATRAVRQRCSHAPASAAWRPRALGYYCGY